MSKGLEAVKRVVKNAIALRDRDEFENDMLIIANELAALDIIKNKKVDVKYLYYRAEFNVEKYNDNYIVALTKEECNLLKDIFASN